MDVATTWHSSGTCSLAPKEKGGVVDIHLKVYGMKNIRVADLSILPLLTVFIRKARFVTSGREASFLWSLLPISTTYGIADKLPTSSKRTMLRMPHVS
ncbi:hypothetical protein BD310DRAFT_163146 [Dichomitus squalens]|uniref:Glucose-methanol-choline oxidoreductase C-terminal domain-containing protein n=1 Tax=Dichomitus squalens TaxID=114155 RepID=A0A4Q9PEJ9_9APHY|nr:hypothetical protein BD310DRAFT_163146 [Dichomitus squalens]